MARLRVLVSVFAALGMLFIAQQAISQEKHEVGVPAQYRIVVGEDRSVKIYDLQENLLVHHKAKEQEDEEVVPKEENPAPSIESLPKGLDLKPQPDSLLKSIDVPEEEENPAPSIESLPKGPDLKPQPDSLLKSIDVPEEEENPAPSIEGLPKGPDLKPQVNVPHSSKGIIPKSTSDSPNLYLYTGLGSDNIFSYNTSSHVCTFKTSVANDGDTCAGSFRVGWYLSSDTIINTSDPLITFVTVSSLDNGSHVNLSRSKDLDNLSLSPGIYYAGIYIDDLKQVREKDENDNTAYWSSPQVTWPPGVSVWIPIGLTCGCGNGDTFVVPVKVDNVTGKGIYSYGLEVTFNSSDLEATGATSNGTITSGWGAPTVNVSSGKIRIAGAGSSALSGSGDLVKINFQSVKAHTNGQTVSLHLQDVQFNEGTPSATTSDGVVTFQGAKIAGVVKYFQGSDPISTVTVSLTGGATQTKTTGSSGTYEFTYLQTGQNYQVTASKTGSGSKESSISPFDASHVLRHYVGSLSPPLAEKQKIAADASGNGEITPFDASIILRYYVGQDVSQYEIANWKFVVQPVSDWTNPNTSRSYTPLNSDQADQDFDGILIGDVTGNWSASISAAKPLVDYELLSKVGFEDISGIAGEEVTLPIVVTDISNLYSAGIVLEYNPELLRVTQVKTTDLTEDCIIATNDMGGQLRIALAGAQAIEGSGSLVDVIFKVAQDARTGQSSSIGLARFHLNDLRSTALRKEVGFTVGSEMPATYSLSQSYPNPFNLETQLRYSLAKTGHVTLSIYSVLGQKVRTLIDGTQEAGAYQVIWDGRDEKGEILSSGVYFLNMTAGDFKQTQKILLIK